MSWLGVKTLSAKQYDKGLTPQAHTVVPDAARILHLAEFTLAVQFKCSNAAAGNYRHLYADKLAFDKAAFLRIQGGAGADVGMLHWYYRTLAGAAGNQFSVSRVDDDVWHTGALVRETGPNMFRFWLDGTEEGTDTTDPTTLTDATFSAFGNQHPSSPEGDSPTEGIMSAGYVVDAAMSWAQIDALVKTGQPPAGMNVLAQFKDGGDSSTVKAVLGP